MKKSKLLLLFHFSPPVHGASKVGDFIKQSDLLKEHYHQKHIKLESSKKLEDIGKFSFGKILQLLLLFFKLFITLFSFRPNKIYFTVSPKGLAFYRDFILMQLIKCYRLFTSCDVYFHYHAKGIEDFCKGSKLKKKLTNIIVKNVTIILISKSMISETSLLKTYKKVVFLGNGVKNKLTEEEFKNILEQRFSSKITNILFLSNMIKEKGYYDVLEVAKEVKARELKNIQFHFAGNWTNKEDEVNFNQFIKENNLQEIITFHGFVSGIVKQKLLSGAHLFIFPTQYAKEVFPLSILEALSYGLPILTYNKGAIKDIIDNKFGVISNKQNIFKDFIRMQNSFLKKPVYLTSRKKFTENYTLETFENKLLTILKNEY